MAQIVTSQIPSGIVPGPSPCGGGELLFEGGLHQVSRRGDQASGFGVGGGGGAGFRIPGVVSDWGRSLVLAKTRAPWRQGNRQRK